MTTKSERASGGGRTGRGVAGSEATGSGESDPRDRAMLHLVLRDRAATLERVLGLLRRRRVEVDRLTLDRAGPAMLRVELGLELMPGSIARIRAELRGMADVVQETAGSTREPRSSNRTEPNGKGERT